MKKLFAWVLFFLIIFGVYQFVKTATERTEVKEIYEQINKTVTTSTEKVKEQQAEKKKDIVVKDADGKQSGQFFNEYGLNWTMTHTAYDNFTLIMDENSGGYIAGKGRQLYNTTIGKTTFQEVQKQYGEPIKSMRKGNTIYRMNESESDELLTYKIQGYYVTFFFDVHENNQLRSIQYVKEQVEMEKPGFYGQATDKLKVGFEQLMIELMNQARVEHGLKPLIFDKGLTEETRQHSEDMVNNKYFSHTGSDGSTSEERMQRAGYVTQHYYAENLAYGQYSSIFAHEGLMNSLGHRKNILNENLTHAGVGVAFDANNVPYYTINFYAN